MMSEYTDLARREANSHPITDDDYRDGYFDGYESALRAILTRDPEMMAAVGLNITDEMVERVSRNEDIA